MLWKSNFALHISNLNFLQPLSFQIWSHPAPVYNAPLFTRFHIALFSDSGASPTWLRRWLESPCEALGFPLPGFLTLRTQGQRRQRDRWEKGEKGSTWDEGPHLRPKEGHCWMGIPNLFWFSHHHHLPVMVVIKLQKPCFLDALASPAPTVSRVVTGYSVNNTFRFPCRFLLTIRQRS